MTSVSAKFEEGTKAFLDLRASSNSHNLNQMEPIAVFFSIAAISISLARSTSIMKSSFHLLVFEDRETARVLPSTLIIKFTSAFWDDLTWIPDALDILTKNFPVRGSLVGITGKAGEGLEGLGSSVWGLSSRAIGEYFSSDFWRSNTFARHSSALASISAELTSKYQVVLNHFRQPW